MTFSNLRRAFFVAAIASVALAGCADSGPGTDPSVPYASVAFATPTPGSITKARPDFVSNPNAYCPAGTYAAGQAQVQLPDNGGLIITITCDYDNGGGYIYIPVPPTGGGGGTGGIPCSAVPGSTCPHPQISSKVYLKQIANAAYAFSHPPHDTRGLYGASTGNECVAAVQQVLKIAGLAQISFDGQIVTNVGTFMNLLPDNGYTRESTPQAGDIVILESAHGVGWHAGIMLTNTEMISNGSLEGQFIWSGTPEEEQVIDAQDNKYQPGTPVFFAHNP